MAVGILNISVIDSRSFIFIVQDEDESVCFPVRFFKKPDINSFVAQSNNTKYPTHQLRFHLL
jgi:hypothetical protein